MATRRRNSWKRIAQRCSLVLASIGRVYHSTTILRALCFGALASPAVLLSPPLTPFPVLQKRGFLVPEVDLERPDDFPRDDLVLWLRRFLEEPPCADDLVRLLFPFFLLERLRPEDDFLDDERFVPCADDDMVWGGCVVKTK